MRRLSRLLKCDLENLRHTPHQGATNATTLVCYAPYSLMRIQDNAFPTNAQRTFSRITFLNDLASSIFTGEFL